MSTVPSVSYLLHLGGGEVICSQRALGITLDVFTHGGEHFRVSHGDPWLVLVENVQCLFIECSALRGFSDSARLVDQVLKLFLTPAGVVFAVFRSIATQVRGEEVIRVPVIPRPTGGEHVMFAIL